MNIIIGPAGMGPVRNVEETFRDYKEKGIKACEIPFTYGVFIKPSEVDSIRKAAEKNGIELSIHAPYWINLNSTEKKKIEGSKKRIIDCCEIGEKLGVKVVVFHPGFYNKNREAAYHVIRENVEEIVNYVKNKGWKVKIAAEVMGKVNVFGSLEEISQLVIDTGCSFCIDFAHVLARYGKVDYDKIEKLFPQKEWHCHFSGIVYGEKGEKHHKQTEENEWENLLKNLPKDRKIRIVNESPTPYVDAIAGLKILSKAVLA